MSNIGKKILFNSLVLIFPILYFALTKVLGIKDIVKVSRMPLDFAIFLILIFMGYIVLNGLIRKRFVAATFTPFNIMELSKKNNPKLFFIYLGVVLVCVLSLFLHLIYFDLIVLTAVTFVIWIILALISQAVLPSNRLVKTGN